MQDQNRDEDIDYEYYNMDDDGDDVIRIFNSNKSQNQEIKTKKHNFSKIMNIKIMMIWVKKW